MLVGYMCVSTVAQNLDLERGALEGAGCDRLYEDTCSAPSRIGRSLGHVVELVDALRAK